MCGIQLKHKEFQEIDFGSKSCHAAARPPWLDVQQQYVHNLLEILRIAQCRRTPSMRRCSAMCFSIRNVTDRVWTVAKTLEMLETVWTVVKGFLIIKPLDYGPHGLQHSSCFNNSPHTVCKIPDVKTHC